jgi:deazaflavin-dependent oxidoreductase (nitroreductase family)
MQPTPAGVSWALRLDTEEVMMRAENQRIPEVVFRVFVVALLVLGGIIGAVLAVDVWIARRIRGNQDRVRRLMRAFTRVRATKWYADATRNWAGKTHSPYALLTHVGRRSGRPYRTVAAATAYRDGFVLPLVYGQQCDWCQNALAAGKATLAWHGHTYELERPEIISAAPDVARVWPAPERMMIHVHDYLWLHQKTEQTGQSERLLASG